MAMQQGAKYGRKEDPFVADNLHNLYNCFHSGTVCLFFDFFKGKMAVKCGACHSYQFYCDYLWGILL
jgi:hypothetical protein